MENNCFVKLNKKYLLLLIGSLLLFCITIFVVKYYNNSLNEIEYYINELFHRMFGQPNMNFEGDLLNDILLIFTKIGDVTSIVLISMLIAIWLYIKKYHLLSFWVLAVVSTGGIIGIILKHVIERSRPYGHLAIDDGFSFPSGHSIASSSLILILLLVFIPKIENKVQRYSLSSLLIIIWALILYSRLYFGAHYLSDIIGGVLFMTFYILIAMCIYKLTARWFKRHIFKKGKI